MEIINNSMIKIEIDGIEFQAKKGSKIIEVADEIGIYIPRFCYHKKLSIAANCRMCLVEIEKAPKLFPACATPITDGMKIFTNTEKVIEAQRAIMEFLLINHPLDCPICDQGGECELQDLTVGYGCFSSRFIEKKRSFTDYDLGPLVSTDVTRCILCTRCVRFCEEVAGTKELGVINRGSDSRIFTFLKDYLKSEISGNIIDLCPVGALTAKPSRFKFRPWELLQYSFVSCHDCVGSNLYVHVYNDKVIRIVPKKNELINESWISDRDRFSYEGLYNNDRIEHPMIKKNGIWIRTSWDDAFNYIFDRINKIKNEYGAEEIGCIASSNSTVEELFVLQKFVRFLGSNNLDHRLKQLDFSLQDKFPIFPGLDLNLDELDNVKCLFLIGSDIIKEQPIIALKLRKIANNGGKIFVLNPVDFNFNIDLSEKYISNPRDFINILKIIIKNISKKKEINLNDFYNENDLNVFDFSDLYSNLVENFLNSNNNLILLGSYVTSNPDYSKLLSLALIFAKLTKSNFGVLTDGANTSGAWLTGFLPHRIPGGKPIFKNIGLNAFDIFNKKLKSYILLNLELEFDSLYPDIAINSLKNSDFVLSFTSFKNNILFEVSDVILPIASSYENSGTFINVSGIWQSFSAVIPCSYEIKQGWRAITDLACYFNLPGFFYKNIDSVLNEFKSYFDFNEILVWNFIKVSDLNSNINGNLIMIFSTSNYDGDSLVRRASSLQKVYERKIDVLKCNKFTYDALNLNDNNLILNINNIKKKYCVFVDESISNNLILAESNNILDYRGFLPYSTISFDRV